MLPNLLLGVGPGAIIFSCVVILLGTPSLRIDERGVTIPQRFKVLRTSQPEWLIPWAEVASIHIIDARPRQLILIARDDDRMLLSAKTESRRSIMRSMFLRFGGFAVPFASFYGVSIEDLRSTLLEYRASAKARSERAT